MHRTSTSTKPTLLIVTFLAAVALLLGSCSSAVTIEAGAPTDADPSTSASNRATPGDAGTTSEDSLPLIADPNAPDRLSLKATGSAQGETMFLGLRPEQGETWDGSMVMHVGVSIPGVPSLDIPKFRMDMSIEVTDVRDDGSWTSISSFGEIVVENDGAFSSTQINELELLMNQMQAVSIISTVDRYGVVQDLDIRGLENLPPELAESIDFVQQMENFTTTVPTQEVGVGATWTDTNSATFNGAESTVVTTFVITDIAGDTYTIDSTTEVQMDATITEAGQVVEMTGTITGGGTTVIDVTEPGPLSSQTIASGDIDMTIGSEEMTMTMSMEVDMEGR